MKNEMIKITTSSSVDTNYTTKRWPVTFVIDVSGSMELYLPALNNCLRDFFVGIKSDVCASTTFEIAVIICGGDEGIKMLRDFALVGNQMPPIIEKAEGMTPLGEAILSAIQISERRKEKIKETFPNRGNYFQPLCLVISDFKHNSDARINGKFVYDEAAAQCKAHIAAKKIGLVSFGVGDVNAGAQQMLGGEVLHNSDVKEFVRTLQDLFPKLVASVGIKKSELIKEMGGNPGIDKSSLIYGPGGNPGVDALLLQSTQEELEEDFVCELIEQDDSESFMPDTENEQISFFDDAFLDEGESL